MTPAARARLRLFARGLRGPAIAVILYLLLKAAFAALTEDDGLITPEGAPAAGVAILGVAVIFLRLFVVVIVPALVASRAARAALADPP